MVPMHPRRRRRRRDGTALHHPDDEDLAVAGETTTTTSSTRTTTTPTSANNHNHSTRIRWGTLALLSALVPLLFWLRIETLQQQQQQQQQKHGWHSVDDNIPNTHNSSNNHEQEQPTTTNSSSSSSSSTNKNDHYDRIKTSYLTRYNNRTIASSSSSLVEWADYCSISDLNWTHFIQQVEGPLLHGTLRAYQKEQQQKKKQQPQQQQGVPPAAAAVAIDSTTEIYNEFLGQLLEQYLQVHGHCDYSKYRPTVPIQAQASLAPLVASSCRVVVLLSAFFDAPQVSALVQALRHDEICLVVHVDDAVDPEFRSALQTALDQYNHHNDGSSSSLSAHPAAVLVQFGSILYRTETLSLVNLKILRWLTEANNLLYDYVVLLDGSGYPLVSATELVQRLLLLGLPPAAASSSSQPLDSSNNHHHHRRRRHVWLGALTHNGANATGTAWDFRWQRKRLLDPVTKWHRRLPRHPSAMLSGRMLPERLRQHLQYKSTSGNQAIYSRTVVQALLQSDTVMELFALAKYGCCCCLEENSWIAALSMIGYADEALEQEPAMFQSWGGGGDAECVGSMHNAVLSRNASLCFRTEDPLDNNNNNNNNNENFRSLYYRGNETWDRLQAARARGVLLARKFRSDRPDSVQLRHDIRDQLWNQ